MRSGGHARAMIAEGLLAMHGLLHGNVHTYNITGIIESGFGSLEAFDSLVSKLLSSVSRRSVAEQTEVVRRRSLRPNVVS